MIKKTDRITVETGDILEAVRDLQYRLQLIFDSNEIFKANIKIRRKIQGSITALGKIDNYLCDAMYMYRTGNTEIEKEDIY